MLFTAGPRRVVMGIIDDGIAFAHERFRRADGTTRIANWWMQDGVWDSVGNGPPIGHGRQRDMGQINQLLTDCKHDLVVNEDEVYARVGLVDYRRAGHKSVAWRAAHGTHVMDVACGYDPADDRIDRPIVAVQLPTRLTADTSGTADGGLLSPIFALPLAKANQVFQAIFYILACAAKIDLHAPVVINLSYGLIAGPHDGKLPLEAAVDWLIAALRTVNVHVEVVLPAGNNYLSRCHALLAFPAQNTVRSLSWRIRPDDKTPSFLEVRLPSPPNPLLGSRLAVTLTPPGGTESPLVEERLGDLWIWKDSAGREIARVAYTFKLLPAPHSWFLISVSPTASLDPYGALGPGLANATLAPSGAWTVKLYNRQLSPAQPVHVWIQRDDSLYGFPRLGRQSYFEEDLYKLFDDGGRPNEDDAKDRAGALTRRRGTINAIATGTQTNVIGGWVRRDGRLPSYAAAGTAGVPPATRAAPNYIVPTDDSLVHAGVLAAGSRSGSVVAMSGTSVAAPRFARALADHLGGVAPLPPATAIGGLPERIGNGLIDLPPVVGLRRYE
jgi:hypothetical protein